MEVNLIFHLALKRTKDECVMPQLFDKLSKAFNPCKEDTGCSNILELQEPFLYLTEGVLDFLQVAS